MSEHPCLAVPRPPSATSMVLLILKSSSELAGLRRMTVQLEPATAAS